MQKNKNRVLIGSIITFIVSLTVFISSKYDNLYYLASLDKSLEDVSLVQIGIGILSLLILFLSSLVFATSFTRKYLIFRSDKEEFFVHLIKIIFSVLLFPFVLIFKIFNKRQSGVPDTIHIRKSVLILVFIFFALPFWASYYYIVIIDLSGNYYVEVRISGESNSMYPTFGKEIVDYSDISDTPAMHDYIQGRPINKKDIVIFSLDKNSSDTYIKRVIGTENDTLKLKDGLVYVNDQYFDEPYTHLPRSTFGSYFLNECMATSVPDNMIFVMGDNRTRSGDSREFGFVPVENVINILPFNEQIGLYDKNWRDTSKDLDKSSAISVDKNEFLKEVNEKREELGLQALNYDKRLEYSLPEIDDINLDIVFMNLKKVGYPYPEVYSYLFYRGGYSTSDLIETVLDDLVEGEYLFDGEYRDIGISEINLNRNSCSSRIVLFQLASSRDIFYWQDILDNLIYIYPSWNDIRLDKIFYEANKEKVDRLLYLLDLRIKNLKEIITALESDTPLSKEQSDKTYADIGYSKELGKLIKELNELLEMEEGE